jgi:hypothetical protein
MVLGRVARNLHNTFLAVALIATGVSVFTASSFLKTAQNEPQGGILLHMNMKNMKMNPPQQQPSLKLQSTMIPMKARAETETAGKIWGTREEEAVVVDADPVVAQQLHSQSSSSSSSLPPEPLQNFHIAFSTGCSPGQDWQAYALFYSILASGQPGHVTRVASGCSDQELEALTASHLTTIQTMSDRFHLHTTPNYSRVIKGTDYNFFNKPFGLRHWMQTLLGFPTNTEHDDTIFIILDPDQLVIRPFVQDYADEAEFWHPANNNKPISHAAVTRGHPMGQLYGFGAGWMPDVNMSAIFPNNNNNNETTSVNYNDDNNYNNKDWNPTKVRQSYAAGPPYMAVGRDMYNIVNTWATIAVPVYQQTKDHLSEMFAYVVAAVHLGLAHQLATSFMVSAASMSSSKEGWNWIDDDQAHSSNSNNDSIGRVDQVPPQPLPHVIHYCQRYFLGPWFFSKYQLPKNFFSCDHALLAEPDFYGTEQLYNSSVTLDGTFHKIPVIERPRMAFMLRELSVRLNDASVYYKQHHCDLTTANFSRSFVFKPKTDQLQARKKGTE